MFCAPVGNQNMNDGNAEDGDDDDDDDVDDEDDDGNSLPDIEEYDYDYYFDAMGTHEDIAPSEGVTTDQPRKVPEFASVPVLGHVPEAHHASYSTFKFTSESSSLSVGALSAAEKIAADFRASLLPPPQSHPASSIGSPPPPPPPPPTTTLDMNRMQEAAETFNNAIHNEAEGTAECRRKVTNPATGVDQHARGGVNFFGNMENPDAIVIIMCFTFPTQKELGQGNLDYTLLGNPFIPCMSDPSNATAMIALCFIATILMLFSMVVFVVVDACPTTKKEGHNQIDPTLEMWKQFSPHVKVFLDECFAAGAAGAFFVSPQAFDKADAANLGHVVSEVTYAHNATVKKILLPDGRTVPVGTASVHMGQAAYCAASLKLKYAYLAIIITVFMATLCAAGVPITSDHVMQVESAAQKLIDLRNTSGKAFNMASFIVALHHTMYFLFVAEFGNDEGTRRYLEWKFTYHSECGKLGAAALAAKPADPTYGPMESVKGATFTNKAQQNGSNNALANTGKKYKRSAALQVKMDVDAAAKAGAATKKWAEKHEAHAVGVAYFAAKKKEADAAVMKRPGAAAKAAKKGDFPLRPMYHNWNARALTKEATVLRCSLVGLKTADQIKASSSKRRASCL